MYENVAVVGMDIHKLFSKAVVLEKGTRKVLDQRVVSHEGKSFMQKFLGEFAAGTPVVLEATFNWPWITDVAEECGLQPHLADPAGAREKAGKRSKTDRKDALWVGFSPRVVRHQDSASKNQQSPSPQRCRDAEKHREEGIHHRDTKNTKKRLTGRFW